MKMTLYKTMHHFFPSFNNWVKQTNDPRNANAIIYSLTTLTWEGILLFLLKLGSRRQINYQFNSDEFIENLSLLGGQDIERPAYDGTLAYLLKKIEPLQVSRIILKMVKRLIRMRCLEKFRLFGYYLVAIDGTGYLTFKKPHCRHCLKKEKDGKALYYYHPVLEAKLILANGMALSIDTEFMENADGKSKQDCERVALYRLTERLKKNFPQLKICLLSDALHNTQKVFGICRKNNWKYIITFKEGSMRAVYREYLTLKDLNQDCQGEYKREGLSRKYHWVNDIDYEDYKLNILESEEIKDDKKTRFVWVTNFIIGKSNYRSLAEKGGRLRWKIENEGFNMQKNGGYNLKHKYSEHPLALKNFYLLLQIAHIINQLMEKGSLLKNEIKRTFGSIRNIARRLLESLRTSIFNETELYAIKLSRFQIRLAGP